jgi:hypothetical protein
MVSAVIACTLQLCCAKQRSHCCAFKSNRAVVSCSTLVVFNPAATARGGGVVTAAGASAFSKPLARCTYYCHYAFLLLVLPTQ